MMAGTEALNPLNSLGQQHTYRMHHQQQQHRNRASIEHHSVAAQQQQLSSGSNSQNSQQSIGRGRQRSNNSNKPLRVLFYKNGDRYFGGKAVTVPVNRHYSIRDLMSDLNKSVDLPYGVRRVYTPVSGREINSIDELVDGSSYVCASFEPFRSVRYGINADGAAVFNGEHTTSRNAGAWNTQNYAAVQNQTSRQEAVAGATHLPTSLPSLTNPNHYINQQHSNYYVSKHYLKSFPYNNGYLISTNPQVPYPSQGHYPAGVAGPTMKRSMAASMGAGINQNGAATMQQQPQHLPPLAARNPNSQTPNPNGMPPAALQQQPNAHSDAWPKPRLITIVRATDRPRKKITILLNRKALHNYEQFICDVSEAFGLPQWKNDKIRKLVTVRGRKVQGISDFFRDDDVFIGVSGKEPLKRDLVSDLLGEIYPDDGDYVQALCKEWDAARSRNRANKQHQQQQQNRNVSLDPNSHKDPANNNNMSISEEHLAAGENHNSNGKKSKYIVEFDENGRRKRKKKVAAAENDILLEMEVQRQRERLKLMELERKKREQQQQQQGNTNNNTNATTRLNEKDQNQQQQKPHHQKRVNIVTPSGGENQQQQQQQQSEEKTTKIKRRPKLKKPSTNQTNNDENVNTESRLHQNDEAKKEAAHENNNNNESSPRHQAPSRNANATAPAHKASKSPGPPKSDDTSSSPRAANHNNRNTSPQKEPHKQGGGGKTPVQHHSPSKLKRQISNTSYVTDKYELIKTLGDGNFAVVKQARLKGTDHEYAIKVIDKSKMKGKEQMIDNEIYIMRSCNHPNIVKFHEAFETKEEVYLITDLVKGGDLFDAITQSVKFNERDSSIMVQDVCEALFYLHSKNIVHRDLKPENLLVMRKKDDRINIKLADFGLAMEVKEPIYTVCGTPTYVAPEILSEIGYGLEVDMWACGVITYILLCGFPPFRSLDRNQEELFQYIQNGEYEYLMPYWEGISDSSKDLIDHLLVVDIKKRWRAEDVLTHPWIVSQGNTKPLPANFEEHKKEMLKDLKAKASVFSAEPWATK